MCHISRTLMMWHYMFCNDILALMFTQHIFARLTGCKYQAHLKGAGHKGGEGLAYPMKQNRLIVLSL